MIPNLGPSGYRNNTTSSPTASPPAAAAAPWPATVLRAPGRGAPAPAVPRRAGRPRPRPAPAERRGTRRSRPWPWPRWLENGGVFEARMWRWKCSKHDEKYGYYHRENDHELRDFWLQYPIFRQTQMVVTW